MTSRAIVSDFISRVLSVRITFRQISAGVVLFAVIGAPLPVWAYDLYLPTVKNENKGDVVAEVSMAASLITSAQNWMSGMASILPGFTKAGNAETGNVPKKVAARRVKSFETQVTNGMQVPVGQAISLSALPLDSKGRIVDGVTSNWESSNPRIVRISNTSEAVALKEGEVTLTLSLGDVEHEYTILVTNKKNLSSKAPLLEPIDDGFIEGVFNPQNNLGSPAGQVEAQSLTGAAATRIKERAGSANFSFDLPVTSLPGRGIDASLGLYYNSRVWSKMAQANGNKYYYNIDRNLAVAPGFSTGYGHLDTYVISGNQPWNYAYRFSLVSPDGTRQSLTLKSSAYGFRTYESDDGTFVSMSTSEEFSAYSELTVRHSDGTIVVYGSRKPDYQHGHPAQGPRFPTKVIDRNGNFISIAYVQNDEVGKISTITDTLGRIIQFEYNSSGFLISVTVPDFEGSEARRQAIRFYYAVQNFDTTTTRFSDGTVPGLPAALAVLQYVYYPGTATGYKFDYSPAWGMVTKISNLRGMLVSSTDPNDMGYVGNEGQTAASTEYNYPMTLGTPLNDVPAYTTRTDDWLGRLSSTAAPVTSFSVVKNTTAGRTETSITAPDGTISESWSKIATDWQNGLITDNFIKKIGGSFQTQWAHTKTTWANQVGAGGRANPRVIKVENTNKAGQTNATTFEYDNYNNVTVVREFDYGVAPEVGNELRKSETSYVIESWWTDRRLLRLPKSVKRTVNGAVVSRTDFEYDGGTMDDYDGAPSIVGFDRTFNPNTPPGEHCEWVCPSECENPNTPNCLCDRVEVCNPVYYYDASTVYRGNVTKVTSFLDPLDDNDPNASVNTMSYDITGNVIEASMSCCNIKKIEYSDANHYAYPTTQTKGSAPTQLVTEASYNFHTGLVTSTKDENNQVTSYTYNSATLRQTRVTLPNGAFSEVEYNDTQFPYFVKSTSSLDADREVSSWSYFNGIGQGFQTRSQTASGYLSNDVEFDNMGRAFKTYNPYTVPSLTDPRPGGILSTEATIIDPLGRTLQVRLPDNTTVSTQFSDVADTPANLKRTFVTITDQAQKKRRQLFDVFGRIVRLDEPDTDGNLGDVSTPFQPTLYEYDGNDNLSKVTQALGSVTQERVFVYDALSRLRRERQVEALPKLDIDGNHGSESATKWTGVYKYNTDGLLIEGVDARGVKTTLAYDGLNRIQSVSYTGENGYQTPQVTYTYGEARNDPGTGQPYKNNGRLTTVQTAAMTTQGTPATIQKYDYDSVGQVMRHIQTIDTHTYELQYGYNRAGQLTSEKYPSGKIVNMTVDNFGVVQTVADANKTYLNGVTFGYNANGMTSQTTLGNGTVENYTFNHRFQLTSQNLMKGSEILQKYDYTYGRDVAGNLDPTKNNGQLGQIEGYIGAAKQWTQKFSYDSVGRLKEAEERRGDNNSLTYKQVFDFDRFGNLYRKAASNPTGDQQNPLLYTPIEDTDISKSTNRFITETTYDDAGQVTQDNKFRDMGFAYDANGRQVKATRPNTPPANDAHTVYDALGNRVATKISEVWQYMIYDAFGQLVAEYGIQPEGLGGVKWVQQDHQGSVRTITNSNGFVVSRTDHQAFGEEIPIGTGLRNIDQRYSVERATRQGYGLTEDDSATGLNHTWFRKNENQAGRWTSPDPYKGSMSLGDPQSFNRYSYVGGDPQNLVDPSGLAGRICYPQEYGTYFCTGGFLSGGGDYNYNPNAGGGRYYGADAGWGTAVISVRTTVIDHSSRFEPITLFTFTRTSMSNYSSFGGFSGFGSRGGIRDEKYERAKYKDYDKLVACNAVAQSEHEARVQNARDAYNKTDTSLTKGEKIVLGGAAVIAFARGGLVGAGLALGGGYVSTKLSKLVEPVGNLFFAKAFDDQLAGARKKCYDAYGARR